MSALFRRMPMTAGDLAPGGRYDQVKDPCPVRYDDSWHLFGTGIRHGHGVEVLHAAAERLSGPWCLLPPVDLSPLEGSCLAAPGVIASGDTLHMFVQTAFNEHGGRIEHLVAPRPGAPFTHAGTAVQSAPDRGEAGVYDAHPALVGGRPYLVYSAFSTVGQPDIHVARSVSGGWDGPWEPLGPILRHPDVPWHNQPGDGGYEWGLEGGQLIPLPDGSVALTAVGFRQSGTAGARQRVLLALADAPDGPFDVLSPVLTPEQGDDLGENGHATAVIDVDELAIVFQEREAGDGRWRYGLAAAPLDAVGRRAAARVTGAAPTPPPRPEVAEGTPLGVRTATQPTEVAEGTPLGVRTATQGHTTGLTTGHTTGQSTGNAPRQTDRRAA